MRIIYQCCRFLLIVLWIYAGTSKLLNYEQTKTEMMHQIFDASFSGVLAWLVPVTELVAGLLIAVPLTAKYGLLLSVCLLSVFTIYILGGLLHYYETMPCSCGGVIRHMNWTQHFLFNLFFLTLNGIALIIQPKEMEDRGKQ